MPQAPTLRFFLLDSDKKPLYLNAAGNVVTSPNAEITPGTSAALKYAPDGWQGVLIKFIRNLRYLGLNRDFTVPVRFVKDGGKIVRNGIWRYGQDYTMYQVIQKLLPNTFPPTYGPYFDGELDLSKTSDKKDGITVQVVEGGLSKYLKAYENQQYEIPIHGDSDVRSLYLDGIPFTNVIEWTLYENQSIVESRYLGMGIVSQEGTTQGIIVQDQQYAGTFDNPLDPSHYNDNWHFNSTIKTIPVTYTGTARVAVATLDASNVHIYYRKYNKSTNVITDYDVFNGAMAIGSHTVDLAKTIPVGPNEYVHLIGDSVSVNCKITSGTVAATYEVTFTPSLAECLTFKRLGQLLVGKISGGTCTLRSTFLDSMDDRLLYTGGQSLRKYLAPGVGKTSISDFFQSLTQFGLVLSVEGTELVIEKYNYGFQNTVAGGFGVVDDVEFTIAEDITYNSFKFGYPNVEVDKVNGRDEFNVTSNFQSPHKRIVKEANYVSEYHAGMYEIEAARIELYQKDTTDSSVDNTGYMFSVEKGTTYEYYRGGLEAQINTGNYYFLVPNELFALTNGQQFTLSGAASNNGTYTVLNTDYLIVGYTFIQVLEPVTNASLDGVLNVTDANVYHLYRPAYSSITGLLHPAEAYNTDITPAHALINNGPWIRGYHDKMDAYSINFTKGDRNSELSTTLAGVTIAENANYPIGGLGDAISCGTYANFVADVDEVTYQLIKARPYEKYTFIYRGYTFKGWIFEAGFMPSTKEKQKIKLLLEAGTDTTKLIH